MNNPVPVVGQTIASIAIAARLNPVDVAVGLATALSGIAGPRGCIRGVLNERISPRLNLIATGLDSPEWFRAQELIIEPLETEQRAMRQFAAALSPTRLDKLATGRTRDHDTDTSLAWNFAPGCPRPPATQRKQDAARKPTFLWTGLQPEAVAETLDQSPLIYCPSGLLVQSLGGKGSPLAGLTSAVASVDREVGLPSELGRIQLFRAGLFASCREDHLTAVIEDPRWELLWPHCVILRPKPGASLQQTPAQLREGYESYQDTVRKLIADRRDGGGREYEPGENVHRAIYAFTKELESFIGDLPPWARPFFAQVFTVPYRLLWACEVLLVPGERDSWCLPFAIQATREIIHRQRDLLVSWVDSATQAAIDRARMTMLTKLAGGPCMFRDLLRRYSVQKKDVHQPVLMALVDDGLVRLRDDGYLELTDAGRQRLAA